MKNPVVIYNPPPPTKVRSKSPKTFTNMPFYIHKASYIKEDFSNKVYLQYCGFSCFYLRINNFKKKILSNFSKNSPIA